MSADYFLEKSDECFALARAGREVADRLDALGHNFMAKAVELDTDVTRTRNRMQKPDSA